MITKIESKILLPLKDISKELYEYQIKSLEEGYRVDNRYEADKINEIIKKIPKKKILQIRKIREKLCSERTQIKIRFERVSNDIKFLREKIL